ncbi:putative membrane protein [Selenomonas ruminantium subsp. lactilytica TAM6421]|uniref:Putative membrane protein n=1 Tax=Selenomonas ruminantium subsp. lactilytica (strain NBRC 103574 / TAM6421) TaxID=927704 RepID=I0GNK3_SELRL|nr:AI-2E family transporter [Selenomonas ruminantium]BAL82340.1 putative membrane protein [Selenomonas ruminantium subsp. lactilytica TAM6421]
MAIKKYRTSILLAVSFTVLLSTFWFMPQLAFIIFISLLLQLLLLPVVDKLSGKLPRSLAAGLVLLGFISLGLLLLALVSKSFIPTFSRFVTDFPQLTEQLQNLSWLHDSEFLQGQLDDIWSEMKEASVEALKSSLTLLLSLFNKAIDLVIILFVTFYLLKDGEQIKKYLAGLFPKRDYSRVLELFNRILGSLRIYICSQLVICCITAVIVFLYFTIRNLPYASVFAVVSGICEFIPVLGPTVASAFGTLLTATVDSLVALQTAGFYLLLTQVNHNFVYPTLIGKSLNLHPIAIILGIVLGGELLGAAGMFLAVPFIVICKLVIEDIYKDRVVMRKKEQESRWLAKKREQQ